jgi:hypothetical protein
MAFSLQGSPQLISGNEKNLSFHMIIKVVLGNKKSN